MEWDEEETGTPMPAAAKYQNVYLIADTLTAFFEKLTISPSDAADGALTPRN